MKDVLAKVKKEYSRLRLESIRKGYSHSNSQLAVVALRSIHYSELDHNDVESIRHKYTGNTVYYFNMGDAYAETILAYVSYERVTFKIGNWGDLVESGNYH